MKVTKEEFSGDWHDNLFFVGLNTDFERNTIEVSGKKRDVDDYDMFEFDVKPENYNYLLFTVNKDKKTINGYSKDDLQPIYQYDVDENPDFLPSIEFLSGCKFDDIIEEYNELLRDECDNIINCVDDSDCSKEEIEEKFYDLYSEIDKTEFLEEVSNAFYEAMKMIQPTIAKDIKPTKPDTPPKDNDDFGLGE